jgi:site-specific recombinase XerD
MGVEAATFFDYMNSFLDYRKDIYGATEQTLKSNRIDLTLFQRFIRDEQYPVIDGPSTMAFQYHLKNDRGNCGGSINRKTFTLKSYSHFLRLMDVPQADNLPFYDVLKIRQGYRNRPNALHKSQIKSLFNAIDRTTILGIRDYAVYALMYQTGLRVGEVHSLNMDSVDLDNHTMTVIGKGNKRRQLHLTKEMCQILSEYLAVRSFFPNSEDNTALCISKKGNRLAIRTMEDNLKKILRKAGFHTHFNVTCHTLRHSFASHLNDNEVDILVIQSLLGHSSPRSTEPYIHPSLEKLREAMEKLPGVIYMKQLLREGVLRLKFQHNRPRRE